MTIQAIGFEVIITIRRGNEVILSESM